MSSASRKADGLRAVDNLVQRVERVYVDAELCRERIAEALVGLEALTDPGFSGDPVQSYTHYAELVELSAKQTEEFRDSASSMQKEAKPVFALWQKSLDEFSNPKLRSRSEARLAATETRYQAIVSAVGPAQTASESFHASLRDYATYLALDLNLGTLSELTQELAELREEALVLDQAFADCMNTSLEYVQNNALPGEADAGSPTAVAVQAE